MPLFFLDAGLFTPPSLRCMGLRRFIADRAVRLLVPMPALCDHVQPGCGVGRPVRLRRLDRWVLLLRPPFLVPLAAR